MKIRFYFGMLGIIAIATTLLFSSCQRGKVKELEEQNAKLKTEILQSDSIQIQFMNAYAEIEYNLNEIKTKEKSISRSSAEGQTNMDVQQKILSDISEIGQMMEQNRKKLKEMESLRRQLISTKKQNTQLLEENQGLRTKLDQPINLPAPKPVEVKTGSTPEDTKRIQELQAGKQKLEAENQRLTQLSNSLNDMVKKLQNQIAESEARIESLQEELVLMKEAYAALQAINDSLKTENIYFRDEISKKDQIITTQSDKLSTGFYIIGNSKDLKEKGVTSKKGVNPNVPEKTFTKINIYETRVIQTHSSKLAILSAHPEDSYSINNSDPKNLKLEIKNPDSFWKAGRFLVIQIK